jgi:hypothetical protein
MRNHRLLINISNEFYKVIKDYDVCIDIGKRYLTIKEKQHEDDTRKYHHECLRELANEIPVDKISWSYYLPFTQIDNDMVSCETLYAHMNKKDEIMVYLKILGSKQGIRVLGSIVCGAIGIEYFKEDLSLRDRIGEINNMKYHMLISCYNNIVLD